MRKMMAVILLSGAATLGGCATNDETVERAAVGAGIGAVGGAAVGAVVPGVSPVEGAVAGAVVGGVAGAVTADGNNNSSGTYGTPTNSYNDGAYTPTPATSTETTLRAGERG